MSPVTVPDSSWIYNGQTERRRNMKRISSVFLLFGAATAFLCLTIFPQTSPHLSGCPVFPADNIWNTPIDSLMADPNSSAYIASMGAAAAVHPDFGSGLWDGGPIGIPFNIVPGDQPLVKIVFDYRDESDPGPYPIPPDAVIEGGSESSGDRHVLVMDKDQCVLYETWSTYPEPDGSWIAGSGAIFDLRSNILRPSGWTSSDAAGLPVLPGLVRYEEVAQGEIRHALRFTAPRTRRSFVWPARHYASNSISENYPPMGQRFRLKAAFDISDFSSQVQVILTALKKYGMILADNGSAWYISGSPDPRWDNDTLVGELRRVSGSDFEAVDESPLMVSPDSAQARQSAADDESPTTPEGLAAAAASSTQIDLAWNESTDNVGVEGYQIFRNGNRITTTTGLSFHSTGLSPSTTYVYQVAAYDAAGNVSPLSGAVNSKTFPLPSREFDSGDLVAVLEQAEVRSALSGSGTIVGFQARGIMGTVVGGPVYWHDQWWWDVDFIRGMDGWAPENMLKRVSRPPASIHKRSRSNSRSRI